MTGDQRLATTPSFLLHSHELLWHFAGGQHSAHDGRIHLVFFVEQVACVISNFKGEYRQVAFFVEVLATHRYGEKTLQFALAISRLITVSAHIPGKDAYLVVVVRIPITRLA